MNSIQKKQFRKQKMIIYAFVIVTLLASTIRMLVLSKFNFDEYFTINLVRNSWTDVVRLTALDVHPPLYYLVTKLAVTVFGENYFAWHLTSFACFLALLFVTERFVSKYFGDKAAAYTMLALCSVPNMLRYCLQVRMYSMAMLWVTAAFYLMWLLAEQYEDAAVQNGKLIRKYWILLGLANVAAAYTHYFAGVAAVGLSLFLLLFLLTSCKTNRKIWLDWGCYCVGMAMLYLPWLFVMVRQMRDINGNYWIARLNLDTLYGYLDMLFAESSKLMSYGLIIVFFIGIYSMLVGRKSRLDFWKWGSFFSAGFFLLFGVGYSVLRTPILIDRYLVIVTPMLWVVVVVTLLERKEKWIEVSMLILFCLCFMENQESLYQEYDAVENSEETSCLLDNVGAGDVMYHVNVQRLAERAAFLPDTRHLLLAGCDEGEAFHYWTEMIGCEEVAGEAEVMAIAEEIEDAAIWCEEEDCLSAFREAGWQVEEYPAWSVVFYRITRK